MVIHWCATPRWSAGGAVGVQPRWTKNRTLGSWTRACIRAPPRSPAPATGRQPSASSESDDGKGRTSVTDPPVRALERAQSGAGLAPRAAGGDAGGGQTARGQVRDDAAVHGLDGLPRRRAELLHQ